MQCRRSFSSVAPCAGCFSCVFGGTLPPFHWVSAQMSLQEALLTTHATYPASFSIKAFQILALFSILSLHSLRAGTPLYSVLTPVPGTESDTSTC